MKFNNTPPKWDAAGTEPTTALQTEGFKAGYKPPAPFFNYLFNRITACIKEIQAGLSNVDNTADLDKPISTAQQKAIDECDIAATATGNPIHTTDATNAPFNSLAVQGASEQAATTGAQLIKQPYKDSTITASGITFTPNEDGSVTITGTATANSYFTMDGGFADATVSIPEWLPEGNEFTLSGGTSDIGVALYLYSSAGETVSFIAFGTETTFTIPSGYDYYGLFIQVPSGKTVNAIIYPMFNSGAIATEYEPYTGGKPAPNPDYPQTINGVGDSGSTEVATTGKNLYNCRDIIETYSTGTITDDDYITIECDNTAGTTTVYRNQWTNLIKHLKKNTNYRLVVEVKELVNCGLYAISRKTPTSPESQFTDNVIITAAGIHEKIVTTNGYDWSGTVYSLRTFAQFSAGNSGKCVFRISLQEIEDTSTEYEPYRGTAATVPLTEPLYGIGDIKDEIGLNGLTKRFASVIFDGSDDEGWNRDYTSDDSKKRMVTSLVKDVVKKAENNQVANIWCNMFIKARADDTYSLQERISVDDIGRIHIYSDTYNDAVADWCTFLAENPMLVVYELAEPVTEKLTSEQSTALASLQTFEGITNIFADSMANLDVEYFKNTDNGRTGGALKKTAGNSGGLSGADVVDHLESTATDLPLSANQGRVLNERLTADNGTSFRFGVDENGNYGYVITDSAGADTVIPFKSGMKLKEYGFLNISSATNTSKTATITIPEGVTKMLSICTFAWNYSSGMGVTGDCITTSNEIYTKSVTSSGVYGEKVSIKEHLLDGKGGTVTVKLSHAANNTTNHSSGSYTILY